MAVDSSAAAVTTSPTTTTTTTTPATTLPATTTTVATEDLIKQAVQAYIAAYFACGQAPADCDPATFTASQGPSRATVTELGHRHGQEGLYFSTDLRGSYLVAESIDYESADAKRRRPTARTTRALCSVRTDQTGCRRSSTTRSAASDTTYQLYLEDGRWLVGEQRSSSNSGEGNLCPPADSRMLAQFVIAGLTDGRLRPDGLGGATIRLIQALVGRRRFLLG